MTESRVPLYRYYSDQTHDHLYTADNQELGSGGCGYRPEGIACDVYSTQQAGTVPLHRYLGSQTQDHLYTTDPAELNDGWKSEGVSCHVYPTQRPGTVPFLRYYSERLGRHLYTTSRGEGDQLVRDGWKLERVQCYVHEASVVGVGGDDMTLLPYGMSNVLYLKKGGFPAKYSSVIDCKNEHIEFVMRLEVEDPEGRAWFLVTHSQDDGGYVGVAKVDKQYVGSGADQHIIRPGKPDRFVGEMVWWERLDANHPSGGCNHPGNGSQADGGVALVGQDWPGGLGGRTLKLVGNGSKVLFYDFSHPWNLVQGKTTHPYLGKKSVGDLGLVSLGLFQERLHDKEISAAGMVKAPGGGYFLFASGDAGTALWKLTEPHPGATWTRVSLYHDARWGDGSGQMKLSTTGGFGQRLFYVTAGDHQMSFAPGSIRNGELEFDKPAALHSMHDNYFDTTNVSITSPLTGIDHSWVSDNGSVYASPSGGVALFGAYHSMDDHKPLAGVEEKVLQIRAWYQGIFSFGGSGGKDFDDLARARGPLTKLVVRHGANIDAIQAYYEGAPADRHGGGGGREESWALPDGYHIYKVEGRSGDNVDQLKFFACNDRGEEVESKVFGGGGGEPFVAMMPPGRCLAHLQGRSGANLDRIGLVSGAAPTPMVVSKPSTSPSFGRGGPDFNDEVASRSGPITRIRVRHGDSVDAVQVDYGTTPAQRHGGVTGTETRFDVPPGFQIFRVTGRAGERVDQLRFFARNAAGQMIDSGMLGGNGGSYFAVDMPPGMALSYIGGGAGKRLDRIQFVAKSGGF